MKTSIHSFVSKIHPLTCLLAFVALQAFTAKGQALIGWQGGTADYNTPANWVGGVVPGPGTNVFNDNGTNNVVQINSTDPAWTILDLRAGNGTGSGAYEQFGGSVTITGWFRMGIAAGLTGVYTMDGGSLNYNGGDFNVGELGTGVLNLNGGTITGSGNFADALGGGTTTDIVNQVGGIVNVTGGGQLFIGNGSGPAGSGLGIYNISGGTNSVNSYFAIGRSGGYGTLNMTGGVINENNSGVFFDIGTGFQSQGTGAIGILNQSGGTIHCQAQFLIPEDSPSTGTYNLSGTGALFVNNWLAIGRNGGNGTLNMNGGSITKGADNNSHLDIGSSANGILNQTNGAITNLVSGTWLGESGNGTWNMYGGNATLGLLRFCVNGTGNGTLNLNGGILQVSQITIGSTVGLSELNFNGGTLQASANNTSFLSGLTLALAGPGPAVIDSQNFNITIPQEIDDSGGGLTKLGTGTLTLTGGNTYSGDTLVNAGTLIVNTGSGVSGNYVVADNAALGVNVLSQNAQLNAQQNVTLGSTTGSSINFNLGSFGNPTSAPLNVSGTLTKNGTTTVNITDGFPQVGPIPLIQFSSLAGSGNFVLGAIPTGIAATIVTNGNTIALNVTGVNLPRWEGLAGGTWDLSGTTNWINIGTGLPTSFANGNTVVFNDSALGTTNVNLTTAVSPNSITVNNNNLNYTFSGSGSITGSSGLSKQGSNNLTIVNTSGNTYTGITTISGGTLNVTNLANGGTASAIGSASASPTNLVLSGGALVYSGPSTSVNRGYTAQNTNGTVDISVSSNLTLTGSVTPMLGDGFTKAGPAQLTYANTSSNTLSDALGYLVAQGTVAFAAGATDTISGPFVVDGTNQLNSIPVFTNAVLAISNNAVLNLQNGSGVNFIVGDSGNSSTTNIGVVNQVGGTINAAGAYQTWIGQGAFGVGIYNLSAGTFNANNWVAIGRENGNGTFNVSGTGALNIVTPNGGNLDIGTSAGVNGQVGTGVLNQSGGTVSNTLAQTWLGEGASGEPASGTWNMSGGTAWLGETFVGLGGTGTNVMNISGTGSMNVLNNAFIAGNGSGVTATVTIGSATTPGGTLTLNSGADFDVGNNGMATLNMLQGGTLNMQGTLYLTRGSTASGYVYLNSGSTIVAGFVNNGWGFSQGITTNAAAFYFNGGTLQAATGSPYFIQPYVNAIIQTNGAVISDGGFNITALCTFVDDIGSTAGLTKLGSGTLTLAATNTYTGSTVVSNGTLVANVLASPVTVESGAALLTANIINGAVTVNSGGTLGGNVGTIGTVNINNSLSLASGSTTFLQITPSTGDQIAGLTSVSYGGSLIVSNISASPLTAGSQYHLFNSATAGTGNFSSVTVPGATATFSPATGILTITAVSGGPKFNSPVLSGGNLSLTGSGGTAGGTYSILASTNLQTPLFNWTTNVTGIFSGTGTFSNGIPVSQSTPAQFFLLKTP
jgi:fibronectin-binding autotransporter adhesin